MRIIIRFYLDINFLRMKSNVKILFLKISLIAGKMFSCRKNKSNTLDYCIILFSFQIKSSFGEPKLSNK